MYCEFVKLPEELFTSENNKHLMTGHKGNSEFCFPETLNVPQGEAEGNIEVEGKQNSLFPRGQSLSVLLHLRTQK